MKRYEEISSLLRDDVSKYTPLNLKYRSLDDYDLIPQQYLRILASKVPKHPLAKRFDKLVRYTARLIGNPNVKEIKNTYIKLLRKNIKENISLEIEDDIHDLIHLILGQNIKIFLRRKFYTPEEYIYEIIVSSIEQGYDQAGVFFGIFIGKMINKKVVSLTKIFSEDLKVIKLFFKKYKTYDKRHFESIKKLVFNNKFTNFIHLYKFFTIYEMDPSYPLAVNFRKEILNKLSSIVTEDYIESYKKKLYTAIPTILEYIDDERYSSRKAFYAFMEKHFQEYKLSHVQYKKLISELEILPEETKNILKKFILYSYAVLGRYPVFNKVKNKNKYNL